MNIWLLRIDQSFMSTVNEEIIKNKNIHHYYKRKNGGLNSRI